MPVVIGGDNLPSPVGIGLTDLSNIGGPVAPLAPQVPASLNYMLEMNKHVIDAVIFKAIEATQRRSMFQNWQFWSEFLLDISFQVFSIAFMSQVTNLKFLV